MKLSVKNVRSLGKVLQILLLKIYRRAGMSIKSILSGVLFDLDIRSDRDFMVVKKILKEELK